MNSSLSQTAGDELGFTGRDGTPRSPNAQLARLSRICVLFQLQSLSPQLTACERLIECNTALDIVVLGRFKAGKSSLLNHLIGRNLLPVDVIPVTSVITSLRAGKSDGAVVYFQEGEQQTIPFREIGAYITEQENPNNCKQVERVDLEWQSREESHNIRFVDTPGTDSIFEHNTRTTMAWMPQVGAAIFTIGSTQPLSEQDIHLLSELRKHTPEIALLITKADLVTPEELKKIMEFIKVQVSETLHAEIETYGYSIRPGFEQMAQYFRHIFLERVATHESAGKASILRYKLDTLANDCAEYLRLALTSAQAQDSAKNELQTLLHSEAESSRSIEHHVALFVADLRQRFRVAAEEYLLSFQSSIADSLKIRLADCLSEHREGLCRLLAWYVKWLTDELKQALDAISHHAGTRFEAILRDAQSGINSVVTAFQSRLSKHVESVLGIPFAGTTFTAEIRPPEEPDVQIGRIFDIPVDLIGYLTPMWLLRGPINRHLSRRLSWEAEKNLYRLANQWTEAAGKSIAQLAQEAVQFMRSELNEVTRLTAANNSNCHELAEALTEVESLIGRNSTVTPAEAI